MKGKKVLTIILASLLAALALVIGILVAYLGRQWNRTTFFNKTTINGFDVSEKTPDQIVPILTEAYSAPKVHMNEGGKEEAVWTLDELGYYVDENKLLAALTDALSKQKSSITILLDGLMNGNSFELTVPFSFSQDKLSETVTSGNLKDKRVENQDAYMTYDEASKTYSITPEVQGTKFHDEDMQELVKAATDDMLAQKDPGKDITIEFPASKYIKPDVLSTDSILNLKVNTYNSYDKAVITHDFGSQKEVLDWDTIKDWVFFQDGQGMLSEEKIREYVTSLGVKYNTIYYKRTFTTSSGNQIEIPDYENEYGYLIDEDGEYQQLLADIQGNAPVEREPVYSYSGIGRDGENDLLEYVEISISQQHLWFYKDGQLIIDSPVVTGCVAKKTETQTGIFPIAYKESPATLIPANETNGTKVKYWMPFFDGQGLHDAGWRSNFGGNIYQTNGSHGCVNLPPAVAEVIYNNVDTGAPVILYK